MADSPKPSITVCIPNYNHARFLGESLTSVLSQSLPPTEVIVIDDASTDDSIAVVRRFAAENPSVRLITKDANRGVFDSVARGFAEATGEFYYVLPADDKVMPGFLEQTVALLREYPQAGMCAVGFQFMDLQGRIVEGEDLPTFSTHVKDAQDVPDFLSPEAVLQRLTKQPWFLQGASMVIFRREAFSDAGGLQGQLGLFADWFLTHYVALKHGTCYIPAPLCHFRLVPNSYGSSIVMRPRAFLENAASALALMQDERYAGAFPGWFVERKRREFSYSSFRGALVSGQTSLLRDLRELLPAATLGDRILLAVMKLAKNLQWLVLKAYCRGKVAAPLRDHAD